MTRKQGNGSVPSTNVLCLGSSAERVRGLMARLLLKDLLCVGALDVASAALTIKCDDAIDAVVLTYKEVIIVFRVVGVIHDDTAAAERQAVDLVIRDRGRQKRSGFEVVRSLGTRTSN